MCSNIGEVGLLIGQWELEDLEAGRKQARGIGDDVILVMIEVEGCSPRQQVERKQNWKGVGAFELDPTEKKSESENDDLKDRCFKTDNRLGSAARISESSRHFSQIIAYYKCSLQTHVWHLSKSVGRLRFSRSYQGKDLSIRCSNG